VLWSTAVVSLDRKSVRKGLLLLPLILAVLLLCSSGTAGGSSPQVPEFHLDLAGHGGETAVVRAGDRPVFRIRAPLGSWTVEKRGLEVLARLSTADWTHPAGERVVPAHVNGYPVVQLDGRTLITVDPFTALFNRSSPADLAVVWCNNLRDIVGLLPWEERTCGSYVPPAQTAVQPVLMTASWYGQEFAGRMTANGEVFNPEELTAAHRSLPFGTLLRVHYPATGRFVMVRVNDRGPFIPGRQLDLSRRAAERLGLLETGVDRVLVAVVY